MATKAWKSFPTPSTKMVGKANLPLAKPSGTVKKPAHPIAPSTSAELLSSKRKKK